MQVSLNWILSFPIHAPVVQNFLPHALKSVRTRYIFKQFFQKPIRKIRYYFVASGTSLYLPSKWSNIVNINLHSICQSHLRLNEQATCACTGCWSHIVLFFINCRVSLTLNIIQDRGVLIIGIFMREIISLSENITLQL